MANDTWERYVAGPATPLAAFPPVMIRRVVFVGSVEVR